MTVKKPQSVVHSPCTPYSQFCCALLLSNPSTIYSHVQISTAVAWIIIIVTVFCAAVKSFFKNKNKKKKYVFEGQSGLWVACPARETEMNRQPTMPNHERACQFIWSWCSMDWPCEVMGTASGHYGDLVRKDGQRNTEEVDNLLLLKPALCTHLQSRLLVAYHVFPFMWFM